MSERLVGYSSADGVATLVLDAPPANAYSYEMMRQLDEAILRARFDADVHVLLLRGSGERFFCAGADIAMLRGADEAYKYNFCLHANETLNRLEQTPKLVIAALNGHTVGGGLEIALAADVRLARRGAGKLGLPEIALGVLPGTGGTQRLARLVGRARALELMLGGRLMDFDEAAGLGLVQRVFDAASFEAELGAYAAAHVPPARAALAVGLIKRAVQSGAGMSLHDGLALERELQQRLFQSADAREGLAAYAEKREPRFRGR